MNGEHFFEGVCAALVLLFTATPIMAIGSDRPRRTAFIIAMPMLIAGILIMGASVSLNSSGGMGVGAAFTIIPVLICAGFMAAWLYDRTCK